MLATRTNSSQSDTLQVKSPHSCQIFQRMVFIIYNLPQRITYIGQL